MYVEVLLKMIDKSLKETEHYTKGIRDAGLKLAHQKQIKKIRRMQEYINVHKFEIEDYINEN